jgi:hypothetical protein
MRFARVEYSKPEKYSASDQKNREATCELENITGILRPGPFPWNHSLVLHVTCSSYSAVGYSLAFMEGNSYSLTFIEGNRYSLAFIEDNG